MPAEVAEAVATLREGHTGAMEKALSLLQETIFSFSMKVCGHREDAEDTMQETLVQASRKLTSFTSAKALAVWLYRVARTRCLMSRRKSKFAPKQELSIEVLMPDRRALERLAAEEPTPEMRMIGRESAEQLQRAVLQLPPEYRLVLVLHDMEELSTEEIAQVMGLREGTVRVRLHRARVFVRNKLTRARKEEISPQQTPSRHPPRCKRLFAELSDYLDGKLDETMCEEIEQHLADCTPCQTFLTTLEHTVKQLHHHGPSPLDTRKAAATRTEILARYQSALASVRGKQASDR